MPVWRDVYTSRVGSDTPLTLSSFHNGRSIWKMTRAFRPSIALTPVNARLDDMVRIGPTGSNITRMVLDFFSIFSQIPLAAAVLVKKSRCC